MKLKKILLTAIVVFLFLGVALLPALSSGRAHQPLTGPDLSTFEYEEVAFNNGDLQLAGVFFVPEGEGPFPVAVIIHGSGTSRRNSKWYLSVTRHLQDNGVAVLLPDKRGSEKSEGSWVGADFHDLAGDTQAAVDYVLAQDRFAISRVGLIGMSQGGWIAPVVAAGNEDIGFVVSMSGATVPTARQLLHEEIYNMSAYTWPFVARLLAPISSKQILKMDHVKAYADFDPIPYWRRVEAPKFFAFGGGDTNVPVEESLEALRANNIDGWVKVYPAGGHGIRNPESNAVSEDFLDDLADFILEERRDEELGLAS